MVALDFNRNADIEKEIQDWLLQSWFRNEPDPVFRDALTAVIRFAWPGSGQAAEGKAHPSYLPLPGLCSHALGRYTPTSTAVNAAWVLLYLASYLLDKIEDQETGHPIFSRFNPGTVANLTTGFIFHAQRILAELEPGPDVSAAALDAMRRRFNQAALAVCAGQHRDLTIQAPNFNQIWDIVEAKSGQFFSLGAYLGARLVSDHPATLDLFTQVGKRLGLLIQIANDVQGFGKEEDIGSDLSTGKRTLPVLFALWVLPEAERGRLTDLLDAARADPSAEIEGRKIIHSAGAIVYLSLEARKHRQAALEALSKLNLSPDAVRPLQDLLDFASHIRRTFPDSGPA